MNDDDSNKQFVPNYYGYIIFILSVWHISSFVYFFFIYEIGTYPKLDALYVSVNDIFYLHSLTMLSPNYAKAALYTYPMVIISYSFIVYGLSIFYYNVFLEDNTERKIDKTLIALSLLFFILLFFRPSMVLWIENIEQNTLDTMALALPYLSLNLVQPVAILFALCAIKIRSL